MILLSNIPDSIFDFCLENVGQNLTLISISHSRSDTFVYCSFLGIRISAVFQKEFNIRVSEKEQWKQRCNLKDELFWSKPALTFDIKFIFSSESEGDYRSSSKRLQWPSMFHWRRQKYQSALSIVWLKSRSKDRSANSERFFGQLNERKRKFYAIEMRIVRKREKSLVAFIVRKFFICSGEQNQFQFVLF